MSFITPNQQNLSQGELSPLMYGRTDLELYAAGLKSLLNMYSDSRGPAKNREGTKHIDNFSGVNARVETYLRSKNVFYTFVFTDLVLSIIRDINNPAVENYVAPWTVEQIDDIQFVPLPDGKTVYILHPNVQTHKVEDATGPTQTEEILTNGTFIVPADVTEMAVCVCGGGGGGGGANATVGGITGIGGTGGGGSGVVKEVITTTPGETLNFVIGAGGNGGARGVAGAPGGASTLTYGLGTVTSNGGGGGQPTLGIALGGSGGGNGGSTGSNGQGCSAVCSGSSTSGGTSIAALTRYGGGGGGGGYGNGGNGGNIGGNGASVAAHTGAGGGGAGSEGAGGNGGSGKIVLTWETPETGFLLNPVSFVGAPTSWAGENWPSAGTYYQGRLWLGGTPGEPETFLGSKTTDSEDFTIGTTAEDALSFILENFGGIEWMQATKNLLIGTTTGEYIVTADQGLIKSGDIEVNQQSSYGSASIQPAKIGDQVMYVSPDKRKLRAINYEWQQNNWLSIDLTFPSEHITKGKMKDLSWAQHPNNLLWSVLEDGTMCCLTYERSNNIFGWHRHNTQGKVLSSAAGFDGERSILIIAVERKSGVIELEQLTFDYKLDSWIETSTVTEVTPEVLYYVEGFDHLEGNEVQVLIDNSVHPTRIVGDESSPGAADGATGRVYLDVTGARVIIGLGFLSEVKTLDYDNGAQTGSALVHVKRRNKIFTRLLESGVPLINGERGDDRSPSTPMGEPEPLISGDVEVVNLGWDRGATVTIQQDLPLPLTILSIFGEMARNTL